MDYSDLPPAGADEHPAHRLAYDHALDVEAILQVIGGLVEILDGSGLNASGRLEQLFKDTAHVPTRKWMEAAVDIGRALRADHPSRVPPPPLGD